MPQQCKHDQNVNIYEVSNLLRNQIKQIAILCNYEIYLYTLFISPFSLVWFWDRNQYLEEKGYFLLFA